MPEYVSIKKKWYLKAELPVTKTSAIGATTKIEIPLKKEQPAPKKAKISVKKTKKK